MLATLLDSLANQSSTELFSSSIIIVDNDFNMSAKGVVDKFRSMVNLDVRYICEPRQNIALARNRAVKAGVGNLIAFIDDDEYAPPDWLLSLFVALKKYDVDGVLGPVIGQIPVDAPNWIRKGEFFFQGKGIKSGTTLHWSQTRTGNCLITRSVLRALVGPFDENFGLTGGEDGLLFKQLMEHGYRFAWVAEAPVFETITRHRASANWLLRRAFRGGALFARKMDVQGMPIHFKSLFYLKSLCAFGYYFASIPVGAAKGFHQLVVCLQGVATQIGKFSVLFNFHYRDYLRKEHYEMDH
jgi:glycosyltransferase involved in cell wall biosynthesis